MQEFDPRLSVAKVSPRVLIVGASMLALAVGWKLTENLRAPAGPVMDTATFTALQHQAFQQTEAQPGLSRPESVPVKILPGETFIAAVQRAGVTAAEAKAAVDMLGQAMDTVNIKAGLPFEASIARPANDGDGPARLLGLSLRTGPATAITLSRTFDGAMRLRELAEPVREETTVAAGRMEGSLYESAAEAGATPAITAQVVKLFSHKLDFSRDIKPGDQFRMIFDRKVTESGRTIETGDLLYAEINAAKGGATRFYRFDRPDGRSDFFDEMGKNIKGFLLKTPVDGARITSVFGTRRHPVLGFTRAHQGVDFGAGTGTPIVAAGDGVVLEARRWGGYGNWLRVRHGGGWDTGYAHISRYAPGIKAGARVRQGQVIAYVGSTGLATGPHLHYETWLNGNRVNPLSAKVPQGTILAGAELNAFRAQKAKVDAMLAKGPAAMAANTAPSPQPAPMLTKASYQPARKLAEADIVRVHDGLRPSQRQ
jgi:murein DD-endopeptidase MepM/ murein hydrolase activator NlpD